MNANHQVDAWLAPEHAMPRSSRAVMLIVAVYVGVIVGTSWTLFDAPPLPHAVAADVVSPVRCASAPEIAYPCVNSNGATLAALH